MKLGLFSPGSPAPADALRAGLAWLHARGIETSGEISPGTGLHAGPPEERARRFNALLNDPETDAILAVRGGSGTPGILPHIDFARAFAAPKPVIGMSDVTALHLALWKHARIVSISAPMVVQLTAETPAYTESRWLPLVRGPYPLGEIPLPPGHELEPISPSIAVSAEGTLMPCNLSLLAGLIGTAYFPDLTGVILVLEDIHETPQSLDRMVTHLSLSGALRGLGGLVLGQFTECVPRGFGVTVEDGARVLLEWAVSLGVPALRKFPYGHDAVCCALPFGAPARLTTDPPGLVLLPTRV